MGRIRKLIGKKCFLSPIDPADAEIYTHWLNDMKVISNLTLANGIINTESEKGFLAELSRGHNYGIVELETDKLIGTCGFINIDKDNRNAEIGIFIGVISRWNKGFGTEAMNLLLDYGFNYLNLQNVFLQLYAFNENAFACYRKIGFKEIGRRRQALYRNRKFHDIIYMDILPEDFYRE